jgi:hypothetical protein
MLTYADDEGEAWGIVHPTKVRYGINCGVEVKTPEGPRLKGVVMDVAGDGDYVIWFSRCVCVCVCVCVSRCMSLAVLVEGRKGGWVGVSVGRWEFITTCLVLTFRGILWKTKTGTSASGRSPVGGCCG